MKNLLLTSLFAFFGIAILSAQTSFGIKSSIGVINSKSETSYVTSGNDFISHEINYEGSGPVMSAGLFAQTKIGYLWVSTEVLYTQFNMNYKVKSFLVNDRFNEGSMISEKQQYIDVPVVAGLTSNNFRIGVGPVFHFLANLDSDFDEFDFYNEKARKLTQGFMGVIGYDYNHLHIDLSYENVFRGLGYHINYGYKNSRFKGSPGHLKVSLGYSF